MIHTLWQDLGGLAPAARGGRILLGSLSRGMLSMVPNLTPIFLTLGLMGWHEIPLESRLQRGEPLVLLNDGDAGARRISDHELVHVSNDLASFTARAKVTAAVRPGQVQLYHAWEPYQLRGGRSHQALAPSPMKVTQLVGGYGHLHWAFARYEPNQVNRDTRVEVTRA